MGFVAVILAVPVAAMALYVFFVEPLWVLPLLERMTPNIVYRVRTEKPLVGLSFDDGPHPEFTPHALEILERYGAKATFFLIGERAERNPDLVQRIREAGHEIGNHYWKDGPTLGHSNGEFVEKLQATERALENAKTNPGFPTTSGQVPTEPGALEGNGLLCATADRQKAGLATAEKRARLFRAPGGVAWPWQLRLAREQGYTCVLGCAYPHDPMRPPVTYIRWLIEKNLAPGMIVILHDGIRDATRSMEALPHILAEGKRRGFRFVSIGELMESRKK